MNTATEQRNDSLSTITIYFQDVNRTALMTPEEETATARRFRETGDDRYGDLLVKANLRFVIKVAMEYKNYGFPVMDLVQEGNLGLLKAVQRFDPDRGYRLISYAVWWIRAGIQEYILRNWSLVKLGTTQLQRRLFNNLQSAQKRLERMLASSSESEQIRILADQVGGTPQDVREMQQRLANRDASLDAPSGGRDDNGYTLMDRLNGDEAENTVEANLEGEQIRQALGQALQEAVECLSERERRIIRERHLAESPRTLKDLGQEFGVSKERVRQLEARALGQIRELMGPREAILQ